MRCPRCQFDNPSTMKFCVECGAKLVILCPQCGTENQPTFKFCGQCGASLMVTQPTRTAENPQTTPPRPEKAIHRYTPAYLTEKILTSRSALEGERKQVTVLFADIKGSTELIAGLDPEEARQILDPVLHTMMEAVHRYEGMVNQVLGDGIMALFGAPVAHEDHALRACYAALAMQEAIRRHTEQIRRTHGIEVQIRVGLNSGTVVVRAISNNLHMDYSAIGQTTHLAARMEQLATPGTIRLTGETLRLVEGLIQVQSLGPIPVKGMTDPIAVFELVGASPIRRRLQAAAVRGLTRFVGRQSELEALHQALDHASIGYGQIVAVIGDPGVGKSRLFYEFIQSHHTQGWLVLESASVSYGKTTPYFPVIDLLKGYFQIEPRDEERKIREKVTGKLLTLDPSLQPTFSVHERGLELCRVLNLPFFFPLMASPLGYAYALSGRIVEALPLVEKAVEQAISMGRVSELALWISYLSETYLWARRIDEALEQALHALTLSRESKERGNEAWTLRLLGEIHVHGDAPELEQAEHFYRQALILAAELEMRPLQTHCHCGLGTLYGKRGQQEQARAELSKAIALYRSMEMTFWLTKAEAALAQIG